MKEILSGLFTVLGGLGIFLLGMKHLSEGLQAVGGAKLRNFVGKATTHRLSGIGTGIVSTLITQSSAMIAAMLVGFVSSGMMTLVQTVYVMIGANIGTTGTVWLVALAPSPEMAGLAGLAAGGLLYFFVRGEKVHNLGLAILGFGLVLLGFYFMMKGVLPFKGNETVCGAFRKISVGNVWDVALVALGAADAHLEVHPEVGGAAGIITRFVGYVLEVLDVVHFATVAVGEAELFLENGNLALGADGLGNLEFLAVAFALCGVFGFLEQVDAQIILGIVCPSGEDA